LHTRSLEKVAAAVSNCALLQFDTGVHTALDVDVAATPTKKALGHGRLAKHASDEPNTLPDTRGV
jgi:hypothetical protein